MVRAARVDTAASDGPTRFTPGAVEWQAKQPTFGVWNTSSPWATGSSGAADTSAARALMPGIVEPETRIGRGGQPCVSIFDTQPRKAMTSRISWSLSFGL